MKIGDKVITTHGEGIIVDIEHYSFDGGTNRYGIKLKKSPFCHNPVYLFKKDIKGLSKK